MKNSQHKLKKLFAIPERKGKEREKRNKQRNKRPKFEAQPKKQDGRHFKDTQAKKDQLNFFGDTSMAVVYRSAISKVRV